MVVSDLQTGLEILSRLPLAEPKLAHRELDCFLDCLLQTPLPLDVHLDLLEQSRETLCFVGEELAHSYVNKPLPLNEAQESCFGQVVSLWLKAARSYARCARLDSVARDPADAARSALILHRCIYYLGMAAIEHYRARRELPPGLWHDLHMHYATAEQSGVATIPVADALDPLARSTDCTTALLSLLLIQLAGPYGLSIADQSLVRRWANLWSPLVSLNPVAAGEVPSQFVIDLLRDVAANSSADDSPAVQLRRLDTSRLVAQLSQVRKQLHEKNPPARIGLGDYPPGQCRRLLGHLANSWSQRRGARKFGRRASSGMASVSAGFEAIYQHLCGESLKPPQALAAGSSREADRRSAAKRRAEPTAPPAQAPLNAAETQGLAAERWVAVNQSASGFCLMRRAGGKKITHGQLLAVCPHEGESVLLARTIWLMQEQRNGLIAGVATLAGLPQCVAARPRLPDDADGYACGGAFLLPAVPAVGSEQSLIIPRGWSAASRLIEIFTETVWCVELLKVLEHGPDFERMSFVVVDRLP
jgi:hypothetical protein